MTSYYWTNFDPIWQHIDNTLKTFTSNNYWTLPVTEWNSVVTQNKKQMVNLPSYPHSDVWVSEDGSVLNLRFAVAGYPKKSIKVKAVGHQLHITSVESSKEDHRFLHQGISSKKIDFSLTIDKDFDPSKAGCSVTDGILLITIPRAKGSEIVDLL